MFFLTSRGSAPEGQKENDILRACVFLSNAYSHTNAQSMRLLVAILMLVRRLAKSNVAFFNDAHSCPRCACAPRYRCRLRADSPNITLVVSDTFIVASDALARRDLGLACAPTRLIKNRIFGSCLSLPTMRMRVAIRCRLRADSPSQKHGQANVASARRNISVSLARRLAACIVRASVARY